MTGATTTFGVTTKYRGSACSTTSTPASGLNTPWTTSAAWIRSGTSRCRAAACRCRGLPGSTAATRRARRAPRAVRPRRPSEDCGTNDDTCHETTVRIACRRAGTFRRRGRMRLCGAVSLPLRRFDLPGRAGPLPFAGRHDVGVPDRRSLLQRRNLSRQGGRRGVHPQHRRQVHRPGDLPLGR